MNYRIVPRFRAALELRQSSHLLYSAGVFTRALLSSRLFRHWEGTKLISSLRMRRWKVAGTLTRPNSIISNSYKPVGNGKVVFRSESYLPIAWSCQTWKSKGIIDPRLGKWIFLCDFVRFSIVYARTKDAVLCFHQKYQGHPRGCWRFD